ncbi:ROK family protein [Paenibacillus sp. 1001270B_150601_E10]|uniref:ROK family protein n=1 Tax=Paenibacillus sp. 1001270B_150601_E10 TaxID=2787079 RepID=UPI00189F94BF|nr:ROK family protein [Paenibacillus sp. 1001270B_150601_E10]
MERDGDRTQEQLASHNHPTVLTLAIDAGGTYIKGCLLENGVLLPDMSMQTPSQSDAEAGVIISGFADVCQLLMEHYMKLRYSSSMQLEIRIGIAFPGPFDYEAGICQIQGLGKYERLYGLNIRTLLKQEFLKRATASQEPMWLSRLTQALILFDNDATLFALGVSRHYPTSRMLCLTLGTGLGSAFIKNRRMIQGKDGVPASGMLYAEWFEDRQVDDQFGRRGILRLADQLHARSGHEDVHDLALSASEGDALTLRMWQIYGERLGRMLKPYVSTFKPDRLILGGQISKSLVLFEASLTEALRPEHVILQVEDQVLQHVFYGIDQLFNEERAY